MSLGKAVELKKAIESAPDRLTALGSCTWQERQYKATGTIDDDDYEKEDDTEEPFWHKVIVGMDRLMTGINNRIKTVVNADQTSDEVLYWLGEGTKCIEVDGENITLYTHSKGGTKIDLEALYEKATPAPFGDVTTLQTTLDVNVRRSREIDASRFNADELVPLVEQAWRDNMRPTDVRVVPYKINLYKREDMFREHRDTPEKNLIGTFILGLGVSGGSFKHHLIVRDGADTHKWRPSNGNWIAFYPDSVHEVVESDCDGYRGTLVFKIFATGEADPPAWGIASDTAARLDEIFPAYDRFGFVLNHDYEIEASALKGADELLYRALAAIGEVTIMPAIVKTAFVRPDSECDPDEDDVEASIEVYPLTIEHFDFLRDEREDAPKTPSGIDFYSFLDGTRWSYSHAESALYTGNESRPEEINSLYLHRAMIVQRRERPEKRRRLCVSPAADD